MVDLFEDIQTMAVWKHDFVTGRQNIPSLEAKVVPTNCKAAQP